MRVLIVGAEAYPYAKVGGLGDVLGALPRALAGLGVEVTLLLPRYRSVDKKRLGLERVEVPPWAVGLNFVDHGFGVLRGTVPGTTEEVLFLENDHFFDRFSVYNAEGGRPFPDDADRWVFYQKGVMEVCKALGLHFDVIHAHDSHTGLVPAYLKTIYRHEGVFRGTASVFTIHNLAYQGMYPASVAPVAGFDPGVVHALSPFEVQGYFNFMKAGISYADLVTTVSPSYAEEICGEEEGYGLDGVLRSRGADLIGVLNGIDLALWSPQQDKKIARNFDVGDWAGKRENKRALLERVGLSTSDWDMNLPVLAFVGRLVDQKGCPLLEPALQDVLQHDVRVIALGSGANVYEDMLRSLQARYPGKVRAVIGFDDPLAHQIEAGADMLLMPSQYEPCGLNQMYAMAYGTVPVVRAVGGLADTVAEMPGAGPGTTGFRFHEYEWRAFKEAIYRALFAYQDPPKWEAIMLAGMERDDSWEHAAKDYVRIYEQAVARVRG